MIRRVLLSLTALTVAAAPALADTPLAFERNGIRYVGTISQEGAVQHIVGHEVGSGRTFDLKVIKGRVTGDYAGDQVSYFVPVAATDVYASN